MLVLAEQAYGVSRVRSLLPSARCLCREGGSGLGPDTSAQASEHVLYDAESITDVVRAHLPA